MGCFDHTTAAEAIAAGKDIAGHPKCGKAATSSRDPTSRRGGGVSSGTGRYRVKSGRWERLTPEEVERNRAALAALQAQSGANRIALSEAWAKYLETQQMNLDAALVLNDIAAELPQAERNHNRDRVRELLRTCEQDRVEAGPLAAPELVPVLCAQAELLIATGQDMAQAGRLLDEAQRLIETSVLAEPAAGATYRSLLFYVRGLHSLSGGDLATAIERLEQGDALHDDHDLDYLGYLGLAYFYARRTADACATFARFAALHEEMGFAPPAWLADTEELCANE